MMDSNGRHRVLCWKWEQKQHLRIWNQSQTNFPTLFRMYWNQYWSNWMVYIWSNGPNDHPSRSFNIETKYLRMGVVWRLRWLLQRTQQILNMFIRQTWTKLQVVSNSWVACVVNLSLAHTICLYTTPKLRSRKDPNYAQACFARFMCFPFGVPGYFCFEESVDELSDYLNAWSS